MAFLPFLYCPTAAQSGTTSVRRGEQSKGGWIQTDDNQCTRPSTTWRLRRHSAQDGGNLLTAALSREAECSLRLQSRRAGRYKRTVTGVPVLRLWDRRSLSLRSGRRYFTYCRPSTTASYPSTSSGELRTAVCSGRISTQTTAYPCLVLYYSPAPRGGLTFSHSIRPLGSRHDARRTNAL